MSVQQGPEETEEAKRARLPNVVGNYAKAIRRMNEQGQWPVDSGFALILERAASALRSEITVQEDQRASAAKTPSDDGSDTPTISASGAAAQTEAHPSSPAATPSAKQRVDEAMKRFPLEGAFVLVPLLREFAGELDAAERALSEARSQLADARSQIEALTLVLDMSMEALPACPAYGYLPGHIAAARADERELQLLRRLEDLTKPYFNCFVGEINSSIADIREQLAAIRNLGGENG